MRYIYYYFLVQCLSNGVIFILSQIPTKYKVGTLYKYLIKSISHDTYTQTRSTIMLNKYENCRKIVNKFFSSYT